MRRSLTPLALRLGRHVAVGAIVTWIVAWGCTLWSRPLSTSTAALQRVGGTERCWYFLQREGFGATDLVGSVPSYRRVLGWALPAGPVPSWSVIDGRAAAVVAASAPGSPRGQIEIARGWPWRALYCRRDATPPRGFDWMCLYAAEHGPWRYALALDADRPSNVMQHCGRALPTLPLIRGFLGNTAFFGVLSWLALIIVRSR